MRMKSDSQHLSRAIGSKQQWTVKLAGQKTARLAVPLIAVQGLKWLAPIEDQFRMATGDHALRGGVFAIVLQRPEAIYKRPQASRGRNFAIADHPCSSNGDRPAL